jgi:hypothetical protein
MTLCWIQGVVKVDDLRPDTSNVGGPKPIFGLDGFTRLSEALGTAKCRGPFDSRRQPKPESPL